MAYANTYYSPRIDRARVSRLYHTAKAQRVPMTGLTNRLVAEGLSQMKTAVAGRGQGSIAEELPGRDPCPAA